MEFPRPDFVDVVVAVVVVSTTAEVKGLRVGARVAADSSQGFSKPRTPFWMASKDPKEKLLGGGLSFMGPPKMVSDVLLVSVPSETCSPL